MLLYLLVSIILILSITIITLLKLNIKWKNLYLLECQEDLKRKNKLSMVEYYYREYTEKNANPYTILRSMSNILKDENLNDNNIIEK